MLYIVLVVLCIISISQVAVGDVVNVLSDKERDIENGVQHIVRAVGPAVQLVSDQPGQLVGQAGKNVSGTGCTCIDYNCGCCAHMNVPEIRLDHTVCVNVSYLPRDYGFRATMNIDKFVILNVTISARNPPPICIGIPHLTEEASICLDFYDIDITDTAFSGCVRLEVKFLHVIVSKTDLGCFRIPLKNLEDVLRNLEDVRMVERKIAELKSARIA